MSSRTLGLLSAILLVPAITLAVAAADAPAAPVRLVSVAPGSTATRTTLEVRLSGPFSYTSYQPDGRSLVVDLAGVISESFTPADTDVVAWLSSLRLLPFRNAGGSEVLRLDVTLKWDCEVEVSQASRSTLSLACDTPRAGQQGEVAVSAPPAAISVHPGEELASQPSRESDAGPVRAGPVRVEKVTVEYAGPEFAVQIATAFPVGFETLSLENPARLVVDVPGGILSGRARTLVVDSPWVSRVRVAQFRANPPVTRVVLDLKKIVPHRIDRTARGLRVVLAESLPVVAETRPDSGPSRAEPVVTVPEPAPAAAAARAGAQGAGGAPQPEPSAPLRTIDPVQVASLAPMVPASVGRKKTEEAPLPPAQPVQVATLARVEPVAGVAAPHVSPSAPLKSEARETDVPSRAVPVRRDAVVPTLVLEQAGAPAASETTLYTGERISVNLKNVELVEFFRLIHEISGLNVVLDPGVSGTITLIMVDVPWDQILEIVLRNNSLDKTLEGNVLRIANRTTLKRESEEERDLAVARAEAVDPVTVTRTLNYARAADLESTLTRFLSSRGQLMRDDRTNTLIIRDIPSVMPVLDDLLRQLDRKSQQVEIEARIISARRNFARDLGARIALGSGTRNRRHLWGGGLLGPELTPSASGDPTLPIIPLPMTNLPAPAATSALFYSHLSPNFAIDIILSAAESRGIAKVLSRPRIITQNNVTALIKQGSNIPVQTEVNNTISTQFIPATLLLQVTPQITGDGNILLDILIKNDRPDFAASVNGVPSIVTQEASTKVLVNDGGTVVMGGVLVTENSTSIDQVPFLGSIPVIGHLFKSTSVRTSTEELLFIITPRILPD